MKQQRLGIFILLISVLFFHNMPDQGLVLPSFKDASHTIVFALATYLLLLILLPEKPSKIHVLGLCIFCFFIGLLIELIQPYFGRERSIIDAYNDLAGCSAAGFLYACRYVETLKHKRLLRIAAGTLLVSGFFFPISNMLTLFQRNYSAPVLVNFDRAWESSLIDAHSGAKVEIVAVPEQWPAIKNQATNKNHVAEITFLNNYKYPTLSVSNFYSDWSSYASLSFDVFSRQEEDLQLVIRIHDVSHQNRYDDRFNLQLNIQPGLNKFELPLRDVRLAPKDRNMQMDNISGMSFFMSNPNSPLIVYLDNLTLK